MGPVWFGSDHVSNQRMPLGNAGVQSGPERSRPDWNCVDYGGSGVPLCPGTSGRHRFNGGGTGEIGELSFLIPQNDGEMARFNMLSLTAGIVEETLWRGFLVWYLARLCRSGWPQ